MQRAWGREDTEGQRGSEGVVGAELAGRVEGDESREVTTEIVWGLVCHGEDFRFYSE